MKDVNIISTVVQKSQSGQRVPTGNTIIIQGGGGGDVDIDALKEELGQIFLSKVDNDTAKGRIDFKSGLAVNGEVVEAVAMSGDESSPSDSVIPTTKYVAEKIGNVDAYLRKDQDDKTDYTLSVGGLVINGKTIGDIITSDDEAEASDTSVYSASKTEKMIQNGLSGFDGKYLRKDVEDEALKHIQFDEGITVYQLAALMNLKVSELATIAQAVVSVLRSSVFVDGFAGEGYQIWQNIATGDWSMTLDRLTVRKVMTIYELIIQKIRAVGGMIVVSAGNGKIKEVSQSGNECRITFEDANTFVVNDLMRCQTFTGANVKSYWVEVRRVEGDSVVVYASDFGGVLPEAGDECVLMGNTRNKLRQNLILISATEDGQPRFDCYDGVKSKSFAGCLKVRVGALDGISDSRFPSDMQPNGYGLYGNNCFLTGVFVLSNGNDVMTQFTIMEGMIRSEISSVRAEINAQDNYLSNASFSSNLSNWSFSNDVRVFTVSGKMLSFNGNFYANKQNFAGVVVKDNKNVLRIKGSYILQQNENFNLHPTFEMYDGLYRPRMFYISFKYMVAREGTLRVYFEGEVNDGTFETYEPIVYEKVIEPSTAYSISDDIAGKWNGTGNFRLEFDGDIYIYDLALSDNKLADLEEKYNLRFEINEQKIQANADHIVEQGNLLEEYHSEFTLTAQQLESSFTEQISDTESSITSAYKSLVSQTAREIRAELSEGLTDLETGLTESYEASISATARELRSEYEASFEDVDGTITDMQTDITQNAGSITSVAKRTTSLEGRMDTAETSISQNADEIELRATKTTVNALTTRVTTAESNITINANAISALSSKVTFDSSGNITNISKSGLVLDSEFATMFSTQVTSQGIAKTASLSAYVLESELGDLVSQIEISADQIDLNGAVTFSDLSSAVQKRITNVESSASSTSSSLTTLKNSLGDLAYQDTVLAAMKDETIIVGGYISTQYIDVESLTVGNLKATNSDYIMTCDAGGILFKTTSGTALMEINADGVTPAIWLYKSDRTVGLNEYGFRASQSSSSVSVYSDGISLTGCGIKGFALGNIGTSMSSSIDFIKVTNGGSATLPSASANKGKVIFVKCMGSCTIRGTFYKCNEYATMSSDSYSGRSMFFVSDGSYWYEFSAWYR